MNIEKKKYELKVVVVESAFKGFRGESKYEQKFLWFCVF